MCMFYLLWRGQKFFQMNRNVFTIVSFSSRIDAIFLYILHKKSCNWSYAIKTLYGHCLHLYTDMQRPGKTCACDGHRKRLSRHLSEAEKGIKHKPPLKRVSSSESNCCFDPITWSSSQPKQVRPNSNGRGFLDPTSGAGQEKYQQTIPFMLDLSSNILTLRTAPITQRPVWVCIH